MINCATGVNIELFHLNSPYWGLNSTKYAVVKHSCELTRKWCARINQKKVKFPHPQVTLSCFSCFNIKVVIWLQKQNKVNLTFAVQQSFQVLQNSSVLSPDKRGTGSQKCSFSSSDLLLIQNTGFSELTCSCGGSQPGGLASPASLLPWNTDKRRCKTQGFIY